MLKIYVLLGIDLTAAYLPDEARARLSLWSSVLYGGASAASSTLEERRENLSVRLVRHGEKTMA